MAPDLCPVSECLLEDEGLAAASTTCLVKVGCYGRRLYILLLSPGWKCNSGHKAFLCCGGRCGQGAFLFALGLEITQDDQLPVEILACLAGKVVRVEIHQDRDATAGVCDQDLFGVCPDRAWPIIHLEKVGWDLAFDGLPFLPQKLRVGDAKREVGWQKVWATSASQLFP
jgi:hypothetical protein